LMMVRRAILRVAFLAEVVLAMFSNILCGDRSRMVGLERADRQPHDRRCCVVRVFPENAISGANMLT
jgi:hypothetical protein